MTTHRYLFHFDCSKYENIVEKLNGAGVVCICIGIPETRSNANVLWPVDNIIRHYAWFWKQPFTIYKFKENNDNTTVSTRHFIGIRFNHPLLCTHKLNQVIHFSITTQLEHPQSKFRWGKFAQVCENFPTSEMCANREKNEGNILRHTEFTPPECVVCMEWRQWVLLSTGNIYESSFNQWSPFPHTFGHTHSIHMEIVENSGRKTINGLEISCRLISERYTRIWESAPCLRRFLSLQPFHLFEFIRSDLCFSVNSQSCLIEKT